MAIKYTPRPSPFHTAVDNVWIDERSETERFTEVRLRRDTELKETDWTQTLDSPLSQTKRDEFAAWRSSLRNLPNSHILASDAEKEFIILMSNKPTT
jgi:hypothetical protein